MEEFIGFVICLFIFLFVLGIMILFMNFIIGG